MGLSDREIVYRFQVAADADDFTLVPSTSTDLKTWFFEPLEFLDVTDPVGPNVELRFRVTGPSAAQRYFRLGTSEE